jgi:hypothetical protein
VSYCLLDVQQYLLIAQNLHQSLFTPVIKIIDLVSDLINIKILSIFNTTRKSP